MVTTGKGLAALPKKLVSKILANEYIDFTELHPAKGKARNVPQSLEDQVLVVQAADLMQAQKLIPDLATWVQCFALYATTLLTHQPNRISEMMAYQSIIARASSKVQMAILGRLWSELQAGSHEQPIPIMGETSAFPQTQPVKAVCIKYNKFNGDCKFGRECRFLHVCSSWGGSHPANKCKVEGSKSQ